MVPGRRVVIFTNNSSAYALAHILQSCGTDVAGIIDSRQPDAIGTEKDGLDIPLYAAHQILAAHGGKHLRGVSVRAADGTTKRLDCDLLAVSGGWNPAVHICSHNHVVAWSMMTIWPALFRTSHCKRLSVSGLRPAP